MGQDTLGLWLHSRGRNGQADGQCGAVLPALIGELMTENEGMGLALFLDNFLFLIFFSFLEMLGTLVIILLKPLLKIWSY